MNNNKPKGQHDLPRTYLRQFVIDPKNRKLKSFVYCYWSNVHETKIQKISIDSDRFKHEDLYTIHDSVEPYAIENSFKFIVEPLYNKIIEEIELESNLSFKCRQNLIAWLFYNKYRNKAYRSNIENNLNLSLTKAISKKFENKTFLQPLKEYYKINKDKAKELHIISLLKEDLFLSFEMEIGTKHWLILKSNEENTFLTNDNPGFSIEIEHGSPNFKTLSNFYLSSSNASYYFVLTPKHCLLLSPFWEGTPIETSIHNQIIEFKTTNNNHIEFINYCTWVTKTKYLISKNKYSIEKIINEEK